MPAVVRLIHPAPALAVVTLSIALGGVLLAEAGRSLAGGRLLLVGIMVLGSQVAVGALNDWADRDRDRVAQPTKPIPAGELSPATALGVAAVGLAVQLAASASLGLDAIALGVAAVGSAAAYDLWLSRTPLSVVPYLVSFGLLPVWVAAGIEVPVDRVAAASVLAGPFAAAAHLANTVRDFDADAAAGSRALAQVIGRRRAFMLAWSVAMGVGVAVGVGFAFAGRLDAVTAGLGFIGLLAIGQGLAGADRLWAGMLVAAVAWTVAWALGSG